MPPRLQTLQRLGGSRLCLAATASKPSFATPKFLPVVQTANLSQREKKRKAKQDPYAWAQAQQRKNANLERREELRRERSGGDGSDPVTGRVTPFVESLDSAGQARYSRLATGKGAEGEEEAARVELPRAAGMRNFFLTDGELDDVAKNAYALTKPVVGVVESQMGSASEADMLAAHEAKHARAVEAMRRITSLANASAKHRYHANVQRIIDEFGRHRTDRYLEPRPRSVDASQDRKVPRAGPDTGSSEVQIAILSAKIRALSQALRINRGYKDRANRRSLELLVHRRQKLLKYMERRERGSGRWQNMIEKLGLTEAAWKGQITTLGKQ